MFHATTDMIFGSFRWFFLLTIVSILGAFSLGLKLLSRVRPSEIFLKSIPKDATQVEITYPSWLASFHLIKRVNS